MTCCHVHTAIKACAERGRVKTLKILLSASTKSQLVPALESAVPGMTCRVQNCLHDAATVGSLWGVQ